MNTCLFVLCCILYLRHLATLTQAVGINKLQPEHTGSLVTKIYTFVVLIESLYIEEFKHLQVTYSNSFEILLY